MKRTLSLFLTLLMLLSAFPLTSLALSWDGSSAGGSTNAVNGNNTGYVIRSTKDDEAVVGYRFSVVNATGNNKVSKVIDVFRKTTNGTNAYTSSAKFTTKYNKKQLIANKDGKMTTSKNTTNCYKEANLKFLTALPNPSGVETWQAYEQNINQVLTTLGVGTTDNMVYGDKVLIEPLFDTCLAGEYQALTVTEIAYCGRSVLGGSSDGGKSNGTSSTWGFIANYTNRIWPNKLFTPDGQGLWTAASTIAPSSKATFNVILSRGYGVGIAYNETQNLTYTIAFNGNGNTGGSTASMTMAKDESKKLTANGFTKTGNSFTGWNTKANGSGTSYTNKQSVKNLSTTNGATVTLYAQWTPYVLKVYFNANGGTPSNTSSNGTTYYNKLVSSTNQNLIHSATKSETAAFYQTFKYNTAKDLANASSFGLTRTGYTFGGWNTKADGTGTTYDQTTDYAPTTLASNLSSGDRTLTLYAKWTPNKYTVTYNANGGSGAPGNQTKTCGVNLTLSSTKPSRTGYTFGGWNTNASGTGTNYASGGTYTGNADLTLYAKWTPITYTVRYDANGGSGAPGNQTKTYGVSLTLSSTKPTRTGYSFTGWNTSANGYGTSYASGGTYTGNADLTLYAQWSAITYTVRYDANGGTGAPGNQTKTHGVSLTLSSTRPTRTGYSFTGWNTSSTGYGTSYAPGGTYTGNADLTLYAQWTPVTYTVRYDANGGSGAPGNQTKTYGISLTLSSTKPTRTGYSFTGWNTSSTGYGTSYAPGGTYTGNVDLTLYAQWQPIQYTILFDGNGHTAGSTASMSMRYDETKSLTENGFIKTNHLFVSWNTKADGSGTRYEDKQTVSNLSTVDGATITLYAQWIEGRQLKLDAIAPNAPYREDTDVISSFHLINEGTTDCIPSDHISVRFHVFEDDIIIKTVELTDVVVPANEQNLLYFKWTVPTGLSDKLISISGEIIDNGNTYGGIRYAYTTTAYVIYTTPDTQYDASAPVGFTTPEELPQSYSDSKTWSIWTYEAAGFRKREYDLGAQNNAAQITPDLTANAAQENGSWVMKSGYGITLSLDNGVRSLSGYTMPAVDAYTLPQYADTIFPEYGYLCGNNQQRTLELQEGVWRFRQNGTYGYVHFTPLWYPDGSYTVSVRQSDLWTPAGMLQRQTNTNTITIHGSAYDDWYIH